MCRELMMEHEQSVVDEPCAECGSVYGLAWVYQLAQLKIDVTGEMEVEITGGAANVGVDKLTSGVVPAGRDVQAGPK